MDTFLAKLGRACSMFHFYKPKLLILKGKNRATVKVKADEKFCQAKCNVFLQYKRLGRNKKTEWYLETHLTCISNLKPNLMELYPEAQLAL